MTECKYSLTEDAIAIDQEWSIEKTSYTTETKKNEDGFWFTVGGELITQFKWVSPSGKTLIRDRAPLTFKQWEAWEKSK